MEINILRCPKCGGDLVLGNNVIKCSRCSRTYEVKEGVPVLRKSFFKGKEITDIKYWDQLWTKEKVLREHESVRKKSQIYFRMAGFFRHLPYKKLYKGRILEVGCGGSLFMDILRELIEPQECWGMDFSLPACIITKELHPFSKVVCGDILQPPFKYSSFDFVYSIGLIHHFINPIEALINHMKLVRKGGIVLCAVPNLSAFPGKILKYFSYTKTMHEVKLSDMEACLIDNGFRIIGSGGVGGLQPFLMLESYDSLDKPNGIYLFFRNIISPLATVMNIPLLFNFNSPKLSPFLYVCGERVKEVTIDKNMGANKNMMQMRI